MDHIVNRYYRTVNWQKELNESHCIGLQCDPCSSFCQFSALEYRFTMWFIQLFLSVYRSGVSVYNVIHAALSVSLPFWNIGLQCDSCSSFCQFTVLEYRFTMWSMLLFLSAYRSGVSVYNVIHAARSVSLPFWSIGLQCDPCCSFCQFTFLEYRFTMWFMLLFLSAYRSGVSVYNVIHAALSVSLPVNRYSRALNWQKELHGSHCKAILQNGKLTERAAWITL
jgi:ferredoxin